MRKIFYSLLLAAVFVAGVAFAGEGTTLTVDQGMTLLKDGNSRFVAMQLRHPGVTRARLEDTSKNGQKPFAAVLGCADSRVPVETVFDRGIGDLFTVRVAGNVASGDSVIGSLEYAVGHLHVPLIIILGHTQCGAVGAAVSGAKLEGALVQVQKKIEPVAKKVEAEHPDLRDPALTDEVVKQNVLQVSEDLLSASEEIRHLVKDGAVKIVPAVYNIRTGKVEWLETGKPVAPAGRSSLKEVNAVPTKTI